MAQLISFTELTGGSETVRCTTIDGKTYMSIRDIIMVVCKQNNKRASETWDRLEEGLKQDMFFYGKTSMVPAAKDMS